MKPRRSTLMLAAVAALILSAALATAASAAPTWTFNGAELKTGEKETLVGAAISSSLTIPGVTTVCNHFLYNMKVQDASGKGTGEITELPLYECTTNTKSCAVESIQAKKLPWPTHLETIGGKDFLIVEKVEVEVAYSGALCAFSEVPVIVKGSAGGVINNTAQTATFNKTTLEESKTSLKVGATAIEWNGEFPTEPFETHREQAIAG
jgi:hypothetical protein